MAADANWFQHRGRWPLTTRWPQEMPDHETPVDMAEQVPAATSHTSLATHIEHPHDDVSSSPALLTTSEAARIVRLSPRTLERLRVSGQGPRFTKAGPGKRARVLYRKADIDEWLARFSFASTAEY